MSRIRLIGLDLDGTVLRPDKTIGPGTREAIRAAGNAGCEIVYVTGRPLAGVPEFLLQIPGIRCLITSNGAMTYGINGEGAVPAFPPAADAPFAPMCGKVRVRALREALYAPQTAALIADRAESMGLICAAFAGGMGFCGQGSYDRLIRLLSGKPAYRYFRESRRAVEDLPSFLAGHREGVENFWIIAEDRQRQKELSRWIRETFSLRTVEAANGDLEIGAPGADKGTAFAHLAEMLGLSMEETAAVGDSENDLPLLTAAAVPVAMGNASPMIRQLASFTVGTNEQDGAGEAVRRLLAET